MPWKSTLENLYPNKSTKQNQELVSPDPQTIHNLLAYSKSLSVIKSPYRKGKSRTTLRLILN